jgi:hypothetical protein
MSRFLFLALLVAVLGLAPPAPGAVKVPRGRPPSIDGVVRAGEWEGAVTRPLEGGGAEEGWMADVAPQDGAGGREFRIARRTVGARRFAISYIVPTKGEESRAVRLPATLSIDRRVIDGWNPDSIAIAPEGWLRLRWQ